MTVTVQFLKRSLQKRMTVTVKVSFGLTTDLYCKGSFGERERGRPYHHFSGKNDLLCAIAAQGFRRRHREAMATFDDPCLTPEEKFEAYIFGYMQFAADNPEEYELMFGRSIWKQENSTQELRDVAYPCFQQQVDMVRSWQQAGLISGDNPLRTSQVIWGAVHGIAKLFIDGIYIDAAQIEEVSRCAVRMFIQNPA